MKPILGIDAMNISLRDRVKFYKKRAKEIDLYLSKKPEEWGKFQSEFNAEVNAVFRNIMDFEKVSMSSGDEEKVYKLKRLFVNKIRDTFVRGVYIGWSLDKPYGYAGDFKIIDDIYLNNPTTTGFDRLFDNYFQMSAVSVAVRNRKEDFKRLMLDFIKGKQGQSLRIMDLASGPCRDVKELLSLESELCKNVTFDCYDSDENALEFAKKLLAEECKVNFIKQNAARLAFRKDINALVGEKYDFIYSTGLFDYFDERISIKLIQNLKKLLNPNGVLAISDVRDKYSNPSVHFMEWVGDWNLIYRNDENFREFFIEAGFKKSDLRIQYEQQGIMQYVIASNKQR